MSPERPAKKMRRYTTASSAISGGVFMKRTRAGLMRTPRTDITMLKRAVASTAVWMVFRTSASFFAPKYWEIITDAPVEKPTKRLTSIMVAGRLAVTAPRASGPTKLPTTTLSTVL